MFICSFLIFQYIAFFEANSLHKSRYVVFCSTTSIVFASLAIFRTSFVDVLFLSFLSLFFGLVTLYLFTSGKSFVIDSLFELIVSPLRLLVSGTRQLALTKKNFSFIARYIDFPKNKLFSRIDKDSRWYIFLGVILSVPLAFVIIKLLSNADPIYASFVNKLFEIKIDNFPTWIISRIIFSLIFGVLVLAMAFVQVHKPRDLAVSINQNGRYTLSLLIVIGVVATILGSFLIIEYPYLFTEVSEVELHKFGLNTYSEYVTKGFKELIMVSVIVYTSAIFGFNTFKRGGKGGKYLSLVNIVLLSETIVFILSIFRRVYLYQFVHGLTRVRIYGSFFLAALILLTVFLMLRHTKKPIKWFLFEAGTFVLLALTMFIVRPDHIIATKYKPTVNNEIDYVYIARLSPDAVDGWIDGYIDAREKIDRFSADPTFLSNVDTRRTAYYIEITLSILRNHYYNLEQSYSNIQNFDIKRLNYADKLAYDNLRKEVSLNELLEYQARVKNLLRDTSGSQGEEEIPFDRSLRSPLLKDVEVLPER